MGSAGLKGGDETGGFWALFLGGGGGERRFEYVCLCVCVRAE